MKKNSTLLLVGAVAVALFMFKDKLGFGKKESDDDKDETPMDEKEKQKVDALIDVAKSGITTSQAIDKAKEIANTLQNANVVIKTPSGTPNISIRTGKKKKSKKTGKGKAKVKKALKVAESIFTKYYPKQTA